MSKVAIVTDSTAYLPDILLRQYSISKVPLILIWGEKSFEDGVDIMPDEFYKRLATTKDMPTTSQPTVNTMQTAFSNLLEKDFDVLGIFISSKLSGTIQSAIQAREMLGRAANRITIFDSLATTMAMGWQVLTAARAAQEGLSLLECLKLVERARENSGVYFVVETLEFLKRGGRIGGAQALLGTMLNVKPVLQLIDGRIEPAERVRTKHKAIERIIELTVKKVAGRRPVRLATAHANAEADALSLLEAAKGILNPVETISSPLSPVIGAHAGPGTVALAFMIDT